MMMSTSGTWVPIIAPKEAMAARAWEAIYSITDSILHKDYGSSVVEEWRYQNYDQALLYGYLGTAQADSVSIERGIECLNAAIERAPAMPRDLALFGGLCGLGWSVEHLTELLGEPSEDSESENSNSNVCEEIDALVLGALRQQEWRGSYDLISGLVGFGVYFLERLPADTAVEGIGLVVHHLERLSHPSGPGITWHTGPEVMPQVWSERCPSGHYNLGVAHGIPGIIHFLSEASAAGVQKPLADRMLDAALEWLIAQQRPPGSLSRYSSWLAEGESADSRLAWCYGDLGIVAILRQVGIRTSRSDWQKVGEGLLDHCLAWPAERSGVSDSPICHGAAGVAHIFNRIYQRGGDERCRIAAREWIERTLAMRQSGAPAGGFLSLRRPDPAGSALWQPRPTLTDGAAGVALVLLAAITDTEPDWDRMLLLSASSHHVVASRD